MVGDVACVCEDDCPDVAENEGGVVEFEPEPGVFCDFELSLRCCFCATDEVVVVSALAVAVLNVGEAADEAPNAAASSL